jgi:hypothetical protein
VPTEFEPDVEIPQLTSTEFEEYNDDDQLEVTITDNNDDADDEE